jgi:hypothetical protein
MVHAASIGSCWELGDDGCLIQLILANQLILCSSARLLPAIENSKQKLNPLRRTNRLYRTPLDLNA